MTEPITTTRKILDELNGKDKNKPWVEISSIYTLTEVSTDNLGKVNLQSQGLVLKVFMNTSTSEVRTYLAKLIDIPEVKSLT